MLAVTATPQFAMARDIALGNFMGSGHTCYGMLTITSRGITWMTPVSECRTSPYSVIDRSDGPGGLRITYRLTRSSAKCLFSVLVLTHKANEDTGIGWGVVGHPTLDGAAANRADGTLDCYLYRR
jgi:hypothetical protein